MRGGRNALEKYRLDASQGLINTEFLAELIREYTKTEDNPNGCALSDDVLSELASDVAKFDSGHALIARLIGEELAGNNCSVSEVERLISEARGKAKAFIILNINGLFKVHENSNTAEALVKIFTLRRPFVNSVRPGDPILTPGVVKLMGVTELSGWLAHRQHDLIEEAIGKLLDCIGGKGEGCEDLGSALGPWVPGTVGILRDISEKVSDKGSAVEYFVDNYGKEFTTTLGSFSNCWRRAVLIIGLALAGNFAVPRPEDLPGVVVKDVDKSLGDALRRCGVDDYLLVGNEIPPLILHLIPTYVRVSTEAFIDKYDEAVAEVNRVLNIARGKGSINVTEEFYGIGLASIIASAAALGRPVEPSDADAALYIATPAIQNVAGPRFIMPILRALEPLRDKAPYRYLQLLSFALKIEALDRDTVRYILDELNKILDNYGDEVKGHAWSLVQAIKAYANLLDGYPIYFDDDEVKGAVGRVVDLLNEIGRFKSSLGTIAWAFALAPALGNEDVRGLMERALGVGVVDRLNGVLKELNRLREKVQELMRDGEFMSYVESRSIKADENAVRGTILTIATYLKHILARYRLDNDELKEAEGLFKEVAEEYREIGDYEDYLVNRVWALRAEAIEGSLVGDKLVDEFRQLYEEAFKKRFSLRTSFYFTIVPGILGNYLMALALTGDDEGVKKIKELLEDYSRLLNVDEEVSVQIRLMLNVLLAPRGELSSELGGRLVVAPLELIVAFKDQIDLKFLPALMVTFGVIKPENGIKLCEGFSDEKYEKRICKGVASVARGDGAAVELLRETSINAFRELILEDEMLDLLKKLGFDANSLNYEFEKLVEGLDGKSLVQLFAPTAQTVLLAFMLYALINGDEKLVKAHALGGAVGFSVKLSTRLFLDVYRACEKGCDLSNKDLRQAVTKLLFLYQF